MAVFLRTVLLSSWAAVAVTFPLTSVDNILKGSRADFESSGRGPDEPVQGLVRVVRLNPQLLSASGHLRRGLAPRGAASLASKRPFPAFLSRGRPGPAPVPKNPVSPLHHLRPENPSVLELKKRQGMQMWQRIMDKGEQGKMTMSLPVSLKDTATQTCTAIPFTQRVAAEGCHTVTVPNRLCFGQCSSLFMPSGAELAGLAAGREGRHHMPCSRCAPSRAHTVAVHLRCGAEVREKQVMVVDECKCETGREEENGEAAASRHL
ncbi:DAN domain family member 5 [Lampris incognitus]|uniref:DAN domain family member 5 n=1 Tax=Lampris incognitus TaxID=2546036 RepID=UPI0024B54430|nr:DAN domain family member 5 [Lampris incognitus]